jgi:aspartyl/asparaginyl beta-hydroxylase (cupin superfamily)
MVPTEVASSDLGMADKAASGRRPSRRSTTKVRQVLHFIGLVAITWLAKIADSSVPRRFSLVETTPFIDPRQFEWHDLVTSEWTKVQSELKALLSAADKIPIHQEIVEAAKPITGDDARWLSYFFYVYGQRFEKQCSECPDTARLLQEIPGMKTAFFSILAPGKRIPPHRGPYRGVMRYHLPLLVPRNGECAIRVGDQTATFDEGAGIMFDDTYEHEVWNDTEEIRVVLFLDIMRPMKFPFDITNSTIIKIIGWSPTVRKIQKKQAAWDRAIESAI